MMARCAERKARARCLFLLVAGLLVPSPSQAWGFEAHKLIADRFISLLPPELRPLFEQRKAFIVERSVDPDLWRTAGFEEEPPRHFVDLDFYGAYPFLELPHEYDRAIEKFGQDVVDQQGTLPWRTQEFYGRLRREFGSLTGKAPGPYALDNIVLFAAILAHYVSDGHVPLHSVVNYDGQLTEQRGVHGRWESELFERNRARLKVAPDSPKPITDPREFMFQTLLSSNKLAEGVLQSDKKAAQGREFYDDGYFDIFSAEQLGVLERRLNESITAVAGVIVGAWTEAGRPEVPVERPSREPRRIQQPGRRP